MLICAVTQNLKEKQSVPTNSNGGFDFLNVPHCYQRKALDLRWQRTDIYPSAQSADTEEQLTNISYLMRQSPLLQSYSLCP